MTRSRIFTAVVLLLTVRRMNAFCGETQVTLLDAYSAALMTNENIKIAEEGVVQASSV